VLNGLPHKSIVQFVDLDGLWPLLPHHGGLERTWKFQAKLDDLSVPLSLQRARATPLNKEYTALAKAVIVLNRQRMSASGTRSRQALLSCRISCSGNQSSPLGDVESIMIVCTFGEFDV
jgi:hypothetical protein